MIQTILLLDLDGVLITTPPWKPDLIAQDGYSIFNTACIENLNTLLACGNFAIWLNSSRREGKTLEQFNEIFERRKIKQSILGFLPPNPNFDNRFVEINRWLKETKTQDYLIIDDDKSLLDFKYPERLVLTKYMLGFNKEKLEEAKKKAGYLPPYQNSQLP